MNIYAAASLFAVLIFLYWMISEVFTVLFRLVGLPEEKARFQVTSLLTACGFTTRESEMFLSTRARRRLARATMLFGFIFNVTIVSALINVFVSMKVTQIVASLTGMLIPIVMVAVILVLSKIRAIRVFMDRKIEELAGRFSGTAGANKVLFIDQIGDGCIAQVTINTVPDMLDEKTLGESGLRSTYNLLILLIEHPHMKPEPPLAATVFQRGDRLTVFGRYEEICEAFDAKEYFADAEEDGNI